ncbi:hypothetical protein ACVIIV_003833 [Bradyrhizobium sp. USDA 4354]
MARMTSCRCFARRVKSLRKIRSRFVPADKSLIKLTPPTVHGVVFAVFVKAGPYGQPPSQFAYQVSPSQPIQIAGARNSPNGRKAVVRSRLPCSAAFAT